MRHYDKNLFIGRFVKFIGEDPGNEFFTNGRLYEVLDYKDPDDWDMFGIRSRVRVYETRHQYAAIKLKVNTGEVHWVYATTDFELQEGNGIMEYLKSLIGKMARRTRPTDKYGDRSYMETPVRIIDVDEEGVTVKYNNNGSTYKTGKHMLDSGWELAEDDNEKYLTDLLKKANDGREALNELYKLAPDRLMFSGPVTGSNGAKYRKPELFKESYAPRIIKYSLVEKVKLESFMLGPWLVKLDGFNDNILHIGCQKFVLKDLVRVLDDLVNKNCDWSDLNQHNFKGRDTFTATREGIKYKNHSMTYQDADKLYLKIKDLV